jgi:hypothetical protein
LDNGALKFAPLQPLEVARDRARRVWFNQPTPLDVIPLDVGNCTEGRLATYKANQFPKIVGLCYLPPEVKPNDLVCDVAPNLVSTTSAARIGAIEHDPQRESCAVWSFEFFGRDLPRDPHYVDQLAHFFIDPLQGVSC